MSKHEAPEDIPMTQEELQALLSRLENKALNSEDYEIIKKVIHFVVWMQDRIKSAKLTIKKLQQIIFGHKTEKKRKKSKDKSGDKTETTKDMTPEPDAHNENGETPSCDNTPPESAQLQDRADASNDADPSLPVVQPVKKGHGRHAAIEYTPDEVVDVAFDHLNPGDDCPTRCGGRLYAIPITPGGMIRIYGQSCARVVSVNVKRLRCTLCGDTFTPPIPAEFSGSEKYDEHFKSIMVMDKYFLATPFYRQARFQSLLNIPLAASTQWGLCEDVADCAYPVFYAAEKKLANGDGIEHDDTHLKILGVMKDNEEHPEKKRTGMYTTAIRGTADGNPVCLYYSGVRHGGENVGRLLSKRDSALPPIRQMCDALAANIPKEYKTILSNCLAHGRRKFKEIETDFPSECDVVLEKLGLVYKHDAEAKALNLSPQERLSWHQEHSMPVMDSLWNWMQSQFDDKLVEPNSNLGKAINYMRNHWDKLTRFLHVAGALIDNNLVEQALKLAIRIRKNAMFHKTEHGAFVGALLLSLIATCELNKKNPIPYLTALQKNKSSVFRQPDLWLPWNYESTLQDMERMAEQYVA